VRGHRAPIHHKKSRPGRALPGAEKKIEEGVCFVTLLGGLPAILLGASPSFSAFGWVVGRDIPQGELSGVLRGRLSRGHTSRRSAKFATFGVSRMAGRPLLRALLSGSPGAVTPRGPHRSRRAGFPHPALHLVGSLRAHVGMRTGGSGCLASNRTISSHVSGVRCDLRDNHRHHALTTNPRKLPRAPLLPVIQ
jgi:hypothetical protein